MTYSGVPYRPFSFRLWPDLNLLETFFGLNRLNFLIEIKKTSRLETRPEVSVGIKDWGWGGGGRGRLKIEDNSSKFYWSVCAP